MDDNDTVLSHGVVYVADGVIHAVQPRDAAPPDGFADVTQVATQGTLYPGLIDLHNHMPFDILRLWHVPQKFTNRDAWRDDKVPDYRKLITGPMSVLATSHAVPAIVRYVEAKALIGGTTTGQGITLMVAGQIGQFFRGVLRNVERPGDQLPAANTHVQDVAAKDFSAFRDSLEGATCKLLHLAEGTDDHAHNAFLALKDPTPGSADWAIRPSLAAIHCTALTANDLGLLAQFGGAMVWSPLSNYLLYGQTADLAAARATSTKLRIGLGADWSPSGSKNLFGELKVAKLCSAEHARQSGAPLFSDLELVALATRDAAAILGWQGRVGVLATDARADLIVLAGTRGDPYTALLQAAEKDIRAVMIDGVARYGTPALLKALGGEATEQLRVGGRRRALNLDDPTSHPEVGALSLAQARARLTDALAHLPELALAQEHARSHRLLAAPDDPHRLELVLDELGDTNYEQRPRLPYDGQLTGPELLVAAPRPPLSGILTPLKLDPLTVADDPGWLDSIEGQTNLPPFLKGGLRGMFPG